NAARTRLLHEYDNPLTRRRARQLEFAMEDRVALDRADFLETAHHRDVVQLMTAVLAGGYLRGVAVIRQRDEQVGRIGRQVPIERETDLGSRDAYLRLLLADRPGDDLRGPPRVTAAEFRFAIHHHLRGVDAVEPEHAAIGVLPGGVRG